VDNTERILVIEDDPILRELLADWLLAAGYRVAVAADGGAGIMAARAERPSLVVTDMHMPCTDGAVVVTEISSLYPGIPVIAISGHFGSDRGPTSDEALALGAARAIAKPFKRGDMLQTVKELLASRSA
jgi:CheY-like chemotaxis protein